MISSTTPNCDTAYNDFQLRKRKSFCPPEGRLLKAKTHVNLSSGCPIPLQPYSENHASTTDISGLHGEHPIDIGCNMILKSFRPNILPISTDSSVYSELPKKVLSLRHTRHIPPRRFGLDVDGTVDFLTPRPIKRSGNSVPFIGLPELKSDPTYPYFPLCLESSESPARLSRSRRLKKRQRAGVVRTPYLTRFKKHRLTVCPSNVGNEDSPLFFPPDKTPLRNRSTIRHHRATISFGLDTKQSSDPSMCIESFRTAPSCGRSQNFASCNPAPTGSHVINTRLFAVEPEPGGSICGATRRLSDSLCRGSFRVTVSPTHRIKTSLFPAPHGRDKRGKRSSRACNRVE